jgi:hypothetical protein
MPVDGTSCSSIMAQDIYDVPYQMARSAILVLLKPTTEPVLLPQRLVPVPIAAPQLRP